MFHPEGPTLLELARQALSSTRRGYDLLAPKFDLTPFRTPDDLIEEVMARIAATGPVGSGLDLCCGTGAALSHLQSLCRERAVGLDFSRGMLAVHRARQDRSDSAEPATLVQADALATPFAACFDLVVCFGALGHFLPRDQPLLAREIARVLKPDGRFVFITSRSPSLRSRRWWLARGFNAAMRLRNALVSPPFIMYYLTFLLPEAERILTAAGFEVRVEAQFLGRRGPELDLVTATRRFARSGARAESRRRTVEPSCVNPADPDAVS